MLNIFLIPLYGATGAAIGTLAAEIVVLLVQYNYVRKFTGNLFADLNWRLLISAHLTALILSLWVKFLRIPVIFSLILSSVFFWGGYIGILLWRKEPFAVTIMGKINGSLKKYWRKNTSIIK